MSINYQELHVHIALEFTGCSARVKYKDVKTRQDLVSVKENQQMKFDRFISIWNSSGAVIFAAYIAGVNVAN